MSLFEWFKDRVDRDARHLLYAALPPERTDRPQHGQPVQPREHYVRLWLTEMFLAKDRAWFSDWHPAVHSLIRFQYGDRVIELPYVAGAPKLPDLAQANLGRTLHLNHPLTPLMPFNGGTVELAAGLLAMKGRNDVVTLIGSLSRFADLLKVPQLSVALQVASPLAGAIEDLLGATDGALHLGLHQTFVSDGGGGENVLREGYIAVVLASADEIRPEHLWVGDDRLRRGGSAQTSQPLDGFTYMLFRIERREERDGWSGLNAIDQPYQRAVAAFQAGDKEQGRAHMRQATFAAIGSPDLTWVDSRRIAERLKEELDWLERFSQSLENRPNALEAAYVDSAVFHPRATTLERLLDERVLSLEGAHALGSPDFAEYVPVLESGATDQGELAPLFEAFAVETRESVGPEEASALIVPVLGQGWVAEPYGERGTGFELTRIGTVLAESEAWDAAYRLRELEEISFAEPLFRVAVYEAPEALRPTSPFEAAERVVSHLPGSDDPDWSLRQLNVPAAWVLLQGKGIPPGEDVVVGHPDTGYRRHPEIVDNLLIQKGYDFVEGDTNSEDDLEGSPAVIIENPSHGVSTSSVIISSEGPQGNYGSDDPKGRAVSGVAPNAKLIPIRTSRTVVLLSMRNLARAIEYAVDQGAHVISISMGGVPSRRLHEAVRHAEERGVVVCAAAGNQVRFVVWPAAYPEVVACAACNVEKRPWRGSSRGRAVDVTAPGESVWRAHAEKSAGAPGGALNRVGRGSGTSYAVAHVAGLAALWLSYHTRAALLQHYGVAALLPAAFRRALASTCDRVDTLDDRFGAGLANAERLLQAPLPDVMAGGILEALAAEGENGPMQDAATLFDVSPEEGHLEAARGGTDELRETLARVLRVPPSAVDAEMEAVGEELIFHLMTRPSDYDQLSAAMRAGPSPFESDDPRVETVRTHLRSVARSPRLRALLDQP